MGRSYDMSNTEELAAQDFARQPVTARARHLENLQRISVKRTCEHARKSDGCLGNVDVETLKHDPTSKSCSACIIADEEYTCRECDCEIPEARKKRVPGALCFDCQTELERKSKGHYRN